MAFGFILFAGLSLFAALAAIAVSVRLAYEGRAAQTLTAMVLWHAIVLLPLTWLCWTNHLSRFAAGMLVSSASLGSFTLSFLGREPTQHARALAQACLGILRLPLDGIRRAFQCSAFAAFGALFSFGTMLWTTWLSYLAPSSAWDGIWYHDTIVGWAIQNHGFRLVQVPLTLENVNGSPHFSETLNLWFVLFTDRRFIEMPNSVIAAPMLVMALYAIARRFAPTPANAIAWAISLYLMPACLLQLRSSYVDVHVAALFLAAVYYTTRPTLRLRDASMAALTLGMFGASKPLALPWMGILGILCLSRALVTDVKRRPLVALGTALSGVVVAITIASPIYVRNWLLHHNPLWPVQIDVGRFDVHWAGNIEPVIDQPYKKLLGEILAMYVPGHDFHDPRAGGYGLGFPFFVLPWSLLMLPVACVTVLFSVFKRPFDRSTWSLVLISVIIAATWPTAPKEWLARYNIQIVAGLAFIAAWSGTRRWTRGVSDALASVTIGTSMIMLYWADPGWSVSFDAAMKLAELTPRERASWEAVDYSFESKAAAAREAEIGEGDVVAFTDVHTFPSLLWNEAFSNSVIYIQSGMGDGFLSRVDSAGAKWIASTPGTPDYQTLKAHSERWQEVGLMSQSPPWVVFRRVR
jgi:hypothetical protein